MAPDTGPQPALSQDRRPSAWDHRAKPPGAQESTPVAYRTSSTIPRDALARLLEQTPELPISWNAELTQPVDAVVTGAGARKLRLSVGASSRATERRRCHHFVYRSEDGHPEQRPEPTVTISARSHVVDARAAQLAALDRPRPSSAWN